MEKAGAGRRVVHCLADASVTGEKLVVRSLLTSAKESLSYERIKNIAHLYFYLHSAENGE